MSEPLRLTTARWVNRHWLDTGKWEKVIARTGSYEQFAYGTDTPEPPWWKLGETKLVHEKPCIDYGPFQWAIICSWEAGTVAVDIDHMSKWPDCLLAKHLDPDRDAISKWDSGKGPRAHILLDMRGIAPDDRPMQGPTDWGDIKARGFIPWPGSLHYSGCTYAPAIPEWWTRI